RIASVGQVIFLGIPLDNRRDVWIIRMGHMGEQMVRNMVCETTEKKIAKRAIRTEILGYPHLVFCPGYINPAISTRQREDRRFVHMGRNQRDNTQQTSENMHT